MGLQMRGEEGHAFLEEAAEDLGVSHRTLLEALVVTISSKDSETRLTCGTVICIARVD